MTEQAFYDPADGRATTATPLGAETFTAAGSSRNAATAYFSGNPFSITEEYTIVMRGAGLAYDTIDASYAFAASVPEPTSLVLLLTGVGSLATLRLRRRTRI